MMKLNKITMIIEDTSDASASVRFEFDPHIEPTDLDALEGQPCMVLFNTMMDSISDGFEEVGQESSSLH